MTYSTLFFGSAQRNNRDMQFSFNLNEEQPGNVILTDVEDVHCKVSLKGFSLPFSQTPWAHLEFLICEYFNFKSLNSGRSLPLTQSFQY